MIQKMTFDAAPSQRRKDENGFMHVDSSHITKEQVVKYYGREIPGWQELKLDPERLYNVYRPAEEIEKSAPTFDGLPLLLQHHLESADEPQKEFRVGSISRPVWNAPYLDCDLHITDGAAIDAIEHGDFKEISAAYLYEPVLERGTFDGDDYEIVMRNLRGNHVALVEKGRAGADVVVADAAPRVLRSFAAWMRKNPLALKDTPTMAWEATKAAMDDAWITVQSNGGGRHVLLGDDGTIKAGMGGKFNGQRIDLIPRKTKAAPSGNEVVSVASPRYNIPKTSQGGGGGMSRYKTEIEGIKKQMERDKKLDNLIYQYSLVHDPSTGKLNVRVASKDPAAIEKARKEITENKAAIIERLQARKNEETQRKAIEDRLGVAKIENALRTEYQDEKEYNRLFRQERAEEFKPKTGTSSERLRAENPEAAAYMDLRDAAQFGDTTAKQYFKLLIKNNGADAVNILKESRAESKRLKDKELEGKWI